MVIFAEKVKKSGEIGEGWEEIFIPLLPINSIII